MSYVRAKRYFKDAQRNIDSKREPALRYIVEGLLQLTESLEKHIAELHAEIVSVRKHVTGKGKR